MSKVMIMLTVIALVPALIVAKNDVRNPITEFAFWMSWTGAAAPYFEQMWIDR